MNDRRAPVTRETLPTQVAARFRTDIHAGRYRNGEVLPSTKALAEQLGVSSWVITTAMQTLTNEGLIEAQPRSKRVVRTPQQSRASVVQTDRTHVVLIGGYAGSGKTELGRILAKATGWPLLDKDTMTRPVTELALEALQGSPNDRESEMYLSQVRPREYEALMATVLENVACGVNTLAAAPYLREFTNVSWTSKMQSDIRAAGGVPTMVWVHCDLETMHTYLRYRGAARDSHKLANWNQYRATVDVAFRPPARHVLVDNSAAGSPLPEQVPGILQHVLGWPDQADEPNRGDGSSALLSSIDK